MISTKPPLFRERCIYILLYRFLAAAAAGMARNLEGDKRSGRTQSRSLALFQRRLLPEVAFWLPAMC